MARGAVPKPAAPRNHKSWVTYEPRVRVRRETTTGPRPRPVRPRVRRETVCGFNFGKPAIFMIILPILVLKTSSPILTLHLGTQEVNQAPPVETRGSMQYEV